MFSLSPKNSLVDYTPTRQKDNLIFQVISRRKELENAYMTTREKKRHYSNLEVITSILRK